MSDEKPMTIDELNQLYNDSESADKELFSEMRTNIQLVAGDHYNRSGSRFWNRLRDSRTLTPEQKIRITKNHIGRIARIYQNSILSNNPHVTISAKNEKELAHQKAAELHNSVLEHIRQKHDLDRKKFLWCKDYVEIGEVATKVFWDAKAGIQIGWEPEVDEFGLPVLDPMTGQYMQSQIPVMSGDLVLETVHAFDLLRDPGVKSMEESPYLIIRKMENTKDLKKSFGDDPDKERLIEESTEDTFRVFQNASGGYAKTKGMTMVRECYYKPCSKYPSGYFWIYTEKGILSEGELPFGIYPIIYAGFDELTTSPRARSIIRQLRPYQIEINRASSKIAEHQITIGDDKVVFVGNSKPSTGATTPGVRFVSVSTPGAAPTVIPGRTGEQYIGYVEKTISEMYQIADVPELDAEMNGQLDPYTMLFRSMRQKQKFSFYGSKFENFLVKVHETALQVFKKYARKELMIPVLGKVELVNMEEFKNSSDVQWIVKVEPMGEDLETKMGKQITLNHILQYIGPNMDKKEMGKFLRLSPYLNSEKMLQELTQDYDNLTNDILALDRGEYPTPNKYDDHEYMIKGMTTRMKQADFKYLPPFVQQLYFKKLQEHQDILVEQQREIQRAQAGFIPSGGYSVVCDLYVPDPNNPKTSKRVRVPSESLSWLLKQLEIQGTTQAAIEQIGNQEAIAQMASQFSSGTGEASQLPQNFNQGILNGYS